MEVTREPSRERSPRKKGLTHTESVRRAMAQVPDKLYFRIGDVSEIVGVKPYVLRYWESEFPLLSPEKSRSGQRVYRRSDLETLLLIRHLLYTEKYSIEGARKRLRDLRRGGELKNYKKKTLHGGVDAQAVRERMKKIREVAEELDQIARTPLREIFRF